MIWNSTFTRYFVAPQYDLARNYKDSFDADFDDAALMYCFFTQWNGNQLFVGFSLVILAPQLEQSYWYQRHAKIQRQSIMEYAD
ncbi:unnamed protein product [Heligmosomoides polygyrus]|uniref:Innexin n=1 Tax=Heligmosomoides polygyrus TaxID=6339 RepID=A0A183FNX0_HELPZ|nr:unnamed protein product [Heligmosomoides polygyrus]